MRRKFSSPVEGAADRRIATRLSISCASKNVVIGIAQRRDDTEVGAWDLSLALFWFSSILMCSSSLLYMYFHLSSKLNLHWLDRAGEVFRPLLALHFDSLPLLTPFTIIPRCPCPRRRSRTAAAADARGYNPASSAIPYSTTAAVLSARRWFHHLLRALSRATNNLTVTPPPLTSLSASGVPPVAMDMTTCPHTF